MKSIRVALMHPDAIAPSRKHPTDAGLDLHSTAEVVIPAGSQNVAPTGVLMDIPQGFVVKLWAKSRSNFIVGAGVVDSGYQGEIKVRIFNPSNESITIRKGEAVAQAVILRCETPDVEVVAPEDLFAEESMRGVTGGIHS